MPDLASLRERVRDRSPEARRQVAGMVAQLYLTGLRQSMERERALALDILAQVLHDAEKTVRQCLAERLATDPTVPRALLLMLANDAIEIARPVLLHSGALRDEDLIDIVRRHATAHQLAIAARRALSPSVGEALAETGDAAVAEVLLRNPGAALSPRALMILADAAQHVADLHELLLERTELSPDLAARLYWVISMELRRRVATRFSLPRDQLDRALQETVQTLIDASRLRSRPTAEQQVLVSRLAEAGAITPAVLIQALRLGQFELFKLLFGRVAALSGETVERMLMESGGEALALACRALHIDKGHFASIFLLGRGARPGDQAVDPRELSRVLVFFDRVKPEAAERIIAGWRTDCVGDGGPSPPGRP